MLKQVEVYLRLRELRDTMKRLYSDRWPEVSAPYRELIVGEMGRSEENNPIAAAIPIAKDMSAKGRNPSLLLATAADMRSL